jgi:ABC-type Na+ efflux pump permease subunit
MVDSGKVYAIAIKDLKEAFASLAIYGPMIGIPLFFAFTLPVFTIYVSKYAGPEIVQRIIGVAAAGAAAAYGSSKFLFVQFFSVSILGPIFMTMPIITASVIAADSFAGEKERKTAESLLTTPASDMDLLLGKVLASLIPAVLLTVAVFIVYAAVSNYFSAVNYGQVVFPNTSWYMMILDSPFLALTTIGLVVLVSARVKGVKEAQQISALLVLPILVIPFVSVFNVATLDFTFFLYLLLALIASSLIVLALSVRLFDREKFIGA